MAARRSLFEIARARRRPAEVRAARRAALCQRRDPHRPRGQQDPEGHHRQVAHAGRLRFALRAGLGLSRPADRAAGGEEARPRRPEARRRCLPQGLPRVRREPGGSTARGFPAPWRDRRLEQSLPDDGLEIRGGTVARIRRDHPPRPLGARLQAGALVPGLPLVARRGRGRVRGAHLAVGGRALCHRGSARRRAALQVAVRRTHDGLDRDLDHDALDAARQPGGLPAPAVRLRARGIPACGRAGAPDRRGGFAGRLREPHRRDRSARAGQGEWRGAGGAASRAPVLRTRGARGPWRPRHARDRHRRRAHGARPWRGRLRNGPALRPANRQPGRAGRPFRRRHADVRGPGRVRREREDRRDARSKSAGSYTTSRTGTVTRIAGATSRR